MAQINNSIINNAAQDPSYALGLMIGRYFANRYEERGKNKLYDSLVDENGNPRQETAQAPEMAQTPLTSQSTQSFQSPQQIPNNGNIFSLYENPQPQTVNPYQIDLNGGEKPITMAQRQLYEKAIAAPLNTQNNMGLDEAANAYMKAATNEAVKTAPPQVGNIFGAYTSEPKIAQSPQPFSKQDWIARVWAEGRRQGRPDSQIQAVIDSTTPMAEKAESDWRKYRSNQIIDQIASSIPSDESSPDQWAGLYGQLMELRDVDPDKANIMMQSIPSLRNVFQTQNTINAENRAEDRNIRQGQRALDNQEQLSLFRNNLSMQNAAQKRAWAHQDAKLGIGVTKQDKEEAQTMQNLQYALEQVEGAARSGTSVEDAMNRANEVMTSDWFKALPYQVQDRFKTSVYALNYRREKAAGYNESADKYLEEIPKSYWAYFGITE